MVSFGETMSLTRTLDAESIDAADSTIIREGLGRLGASTKGVHWLGVTSLHTRFRALALDPRIVGLVVGILGDDVVLFNSKFAMKPPIAGAGRFDWHQDLRFFPVYQQRLRLSDGDARRFHPEQRMHVHGSRKPLLGGDGTRSVDRLVL